MEEPTNEELHGAALSRAKIQSWLANHDGMHNVGAISDGTELSRGSVGQHCAHMADNGLIKFKREGTAKLYGAKASHAIVPVEAPVRRVHRKQTVKDTGIEVCIGGNTLIMFGESNLGAVVIHRNPQTGRPRVTILEDE